MLYKIKIDFFKSIGYYADSRYLKTKGGKVAIKKKATSRSGSSEDSVDTPVIELREKGEITPKEFIDRLRRRGILRKKWAVVRDLIKKKRCIRNTDLLPFTKTFDINAKMKRHDKLNHFRGFLSKLVEWKVLSAFRSDVNYYFCNLPDFYKPEELYKIMPDKEQRRLMVHITTDTISIERLAELVYGDEESSHSILETLLDYYKGFGLIAYHSSEDGYALTERGEERGVDAQSIKTLKAQALENEMFVKREEKDNAPKTLDRVRKLLKRDMEGKAVPVTDLSGELNEDIKILFVGEVLYGNQYTDQDLLSWILDNVNDPTLSITSGLVQGRFEVKNKHKSRELVDGELAKIGVQFHSAGLLLEWLEKMTTSRVCMVQGDDDWRLADDYGTLMHLSEGKNPWKFGVNWRSFSDEMKRRLENKELRKKIQIQWEIIQAYQYRVRRSLMNKKEVNQRIGVNKSEYRLIIEIMVAKRHNFAYPKEYEKVVNVNALYGDIGKCIVTPDPLRLKVAEGKEIRVIHNAGFSDITQYQDTIQHLDAIARHLGLSRQELPWVLADFHQEHMQAEYLMGTWVMNLPGMQNTMQAASYKQKEWNTNILESKQRRQNRVRKEPVSPSVPEITFCRDGRIRFRLLNESVRRVIQDNKNKEEKKETVVIATDTQFGSITMWPEFTAKFIDYGLYERQASRMYINGDFIHGSIYPQNNAENRPTRLTSLHAQKMFSFNLVVPLILDAPNLADLTAWLGNHEWNNWDTRLAGDSPLTYLETALLAVLQERERAGIESTLKRAMTVSRIRWMNSHNPQGDIVNWPFFADNICGFKVAIQHMWQLFGGSNPANQMKKWLKGMARASKDIDILIGGHLHSVWLAELGDKLIVQAASSAGQSGYELIRGLMSTVMFTLVEFSNRTGITVEFVPWEFLLNYKFQSATYRGKDELFVRAKPGTKDFELGKMAPYIENMIDEQTRYFPV